MASRSANVHRTSIDMSLREHADRVVLAVLLVFVFICAGCASLSPSAAEYPSELGGGMKLSDEGRTAVNIIGTALYFLGPFLACGH